MAKKSMKQRKDRKSRKTMKSRREIIGGFIAPVNMGTPVMPESLAQGRSFASYHAGQHGGVADYPTSVSAGPFLSGSMASQAGVAGLDSKWAEIAGMRDQAGGKRRKASRKTKKSKKSRKASKKSRKASKKSRKGSKKSRKASKKSRKASKKSRKASKKSRKASRKSRKGSKKSRKGSRKQRGGVAGASDSYMLLSGSLASKAEAGMSPEWSLAKDPMAFAPK
jgi:hypothetical protein